MKKYALAAVASAVLSGGAYAADLPLKAAPIAPQPVVSGYVGLYIGGSTASHDFSDVDGGVFTFGAVGAANVWLSPGMSLQFSGHAEGTSGYEYANEDYTEARFSGIMGAHLALRDPNSHAIGVFGAFTGANNLDYCGANGGALGGVEGQKYFGNLTLYGQVGGGGQFNNADCGMIDSYWFVRGVARYFIDPNLRLAAEVSYADGDAQYTGSSSSGDVSILSWGASIEHRLMNSPFSVFAEYAGDSVDGNWGSRCSGNTVTQHTFLVGAKINFGEPTLLANDRRGATFDLPKFHRAMPWSYVSQWESCPG